MTTTVRAIAAVRNNHGSRAHDRALSATLCNGEMSWDHLREDQQNTGDEEQVLPGVRSECSGDLGCAICGGGAEASGGFAGT